MQHFGGHVFEPRGHFRRHSFLRRKKHIAPGRGPSARWSSAGPFWGANRKVLFFLTGTPELKLNRSFLFLVLCFVYLLLLGVVGKEAIYDHPSWEFFGRQPRIGTPPINHVLSLQCWSLLQDSFVFGVDKNTRVSTYIYIYIYYRILGLGALAAFAFRLCVYPFLCTGGGLGKLPHP